VAKRRTRSNERRRSRRTQLRHKSVAATQAKRSSNHRCTRSIN